MEYKQYQNSRNLAWEILLREKVRSLPVDVVALCHNMGIRVVEYTEPRPDTGDGFSCLLNGIPHICIEQTDNRARQRFTVAHELGHILLGHIDQSGLVNREPSPQDNPIEQAANTFAARLLSPACVLWGCCVSSAAEIAALCDISLTAASYRWERMQVLLARDKFLSSPLERKVYRQFSKYIKTCRRGQ